MKNLLLTFVLAFAIISQFSPILVFTQEDNDTHVTSNTLLQDDFYIKFSTFKGGCSLQDEINGKSVTIGFSGQEITLDYNNVISYDMPIETYRKTEFIPHSFSALGYKFPYDERKTLVQRKVDAFNYQNISVYYTYMQRPDDWISFNLSAGLGYGWGYQNEIIDENYNEYTIKTVNNSTHKIQEHIAHVKKTSYNGLLLPLYGSMDLDIFSWLTVSYSYGFILSSEYSSSISKITGSIVLFRD
jgi:hypothetical protein